MRQQFVVEFERVSMNTAALLGGASRDARFLADSQSDTCVVEHLGSVEIFIKCLHAPYIHDRLIPMG